MKKLALTLLLMLTLSSTALAYNQNEYLFVHRMSHPYGGHDFAYSEADVRQHGKFGWVEEAGWFTYKNIGDPVYMLGNDDLPDTMYTASQDEINNLVAHGWYLSSAYFRSAGNLPIYRLYNPQSGLHLWTADEYEYNTLASQGWNAEGVGFYGVPANEVN